MIKLVIRFNACIEHLDYDLLSDMIVIIQAVILSIVHNVLTKGVNHNAFIGSVLVHCSEVKFLKAFNHDIRAQWCFF